MRTGVILVAWAAFGLGAFARADAGPIKHWGTFPGREVRAIALRGQLLGGEQRFTAIPGRDGYVYLRGSRGLYRVLDADGNTEVVADTSGCSGWSESHGVDNRSAVPRAICSRAAEIIVAGLRRHEHIRTPLPTWAEAFRRSDGYTFDQRYLTAVVPADDGGYWFGFAAAGGVGRVWPSGRTELRRVKGLGTIVDIVAVGDQVYVGDDKCRIARLQALKMLDAREYRCYGPPHRRFAVTEDGAAWLLGGTSGILVRFGRDGTRTRWKLPLVPTGVAVTRDGTAYVLGQSGPDYGGYPVVGVIVPGRAPAVRRLPMHDPGTIAVDGRDRLWISVPEWHSVAVIAPKGAWR